jgi:uncharacterized OsmC-like protein
MTAAAQGIGLAQLEVEVNSRTDSRGMLGMAEANGEQVYAGPCDCELAVRIAAAGVAPERLQALVAEGLRRSPVPNALQNATPMTVRVEVSAA